MSKNENSFWSDMGIVPIGILLLLAVVTYFGFFMPPSEHGICDWKSDILYCKIHPTTTVDVIGMVMFYVSALVLGGITKLLGINLMNGPNSSAWTIATLLGLAGGLSMAFFL